MLSTETTLAIHGGPQAITFPHPHNDLCAFTEQDKWAIRRYIDDPASTISYYGCEGELALLEQELAAYFGQSHCVLTNSGTNALHCAYFGLGLQPGDEVIGSTNTFLATVTPLLAVGAIPVLADIEPDTGNVCPGSVRRQLTDKTKAIVVTHQWGHPVEMDRFVALADRHDLLLVEDVSLAFGATYRGRRVGSFGHAAALSLGATKLISGGQGGALLTSVESVKDRANLLGHFSRRSSQEIKDPFYHQFSSTGYGHNYRMHAIAVTIARHRLHRADELIRARHERFDHLIAGIAGIPFLSPPPTRQGATRGQWQGLVIGYDETLTGVPRDRFAAALEAEGAEVELGGYHPLLHTSRFFQAADDGYRPGSGYSASKRIYSMGDFPAAEAFHATHIALPIFLHEPMELVDQYITAIRKVADGVESLRAA